MKLLLVMRVGIEQYRVELVREVYKEALAAFWEYN